MAIVSPSSKNEGKEEECVVVAFIEPGLAERNSPTHFFINVTVFINVT
jgi:hypothetical protein